MRYINLHLHYITLHYITLHYKGYSFYEQELQKTTQEMFRIEKVIRRKGVKSLVKWVGYLDEFNSWIDNKDLVKL